MRLSVVPIRMRALKDNTSIVSSFSVFGCSTMAEPQPPEIHDGPSTPPGLLNVTAEDRKAAAALSSLEARDDEGTTTKKDVDTEALGQAMKNLATGGEEPVHKDSAPRKTIKVDSSDVILMVCALQNTLGPERSAKMDRMTAYEDEKPG